LKPNIEDFEKFREVISRIRRTFMELSSLHTYLNQAEAGEKKMISSQIILVREALRKANEEIPFAIENINLIKKLPPPPKEEEEDKDAPKIKEVIKETEKELSLKKLQPTGVIVTPSGKVKGYSLKELKPIGLEKLTLKRMKKKSIKVEIQKEKKPNNYIKIANQFFSELSDKMVSDKTFQDLERDLIKANLQFTPRGYISVIFLTTCLAFFAGILIGVFFLFFKIGVELPIITKATGGLFSRIWISLLIVVLAPFLTFILMYVYPGLEKSSTENRIEDELPFATIHMSAISGSMIDPSKIFDIIISTHEYPYIEKEFKKLINEINLYGYDLVSALRSAAYNNPSKKLSELFNGLATTINSGGDLPGFFDKRAQTLLFENRLEQEKKTKAAETFMDIYISLVIAAPMILMILLMMMKISGLGISMSMQMITIIMVIAVTMINIVFLTFLQLKK
jgi:hypothetical protein